VWRPQRGELGSDTGFVGISIACSSSVSLVPPQWRPRPARGWQRSPGPRVESWPGRAAGVELASDVAANGAAGVELGMAQWPGSTTLPAVAERVAEPETMDRGRSKSFNHKITECSLFF
jgi:hypothetical protein